MLGRWVCLVLILAILTQTESNATQSSFPRMDIRLDSNRQVLRVGFLSEIISQLFKLFEHQAVAEAGRQAAREAGRQTVHGAERQAAREAERQTVHGAESQAAREVGGVKALPLVFPDSNASPSAENIAIFSSLSQSSKSRSDFASWLHVPPQSLRNYESTLTPPPISGFGVIPTTREGFEEVFQKTLSNPQDLVMAQSAHASLQSFLQTERSSIPHNLADVEALLVKSSSIFTILGHNENGYLIVPPHSKISLERIAESCGKHKRICVFISCESSKYVGELGVGRLINFQEASELTLELQDLATTAISLRKRQIDLVEAIPEKLALVSKRHKRQEYSVYIIPAATIGGIGLIMIKR